MMKLTGSLLAGLRYLFVLAAAALVLLAMGSLAAGIVHLVQLASTGEFAMEPGSGAQVVPYFIRAVFLYFLGVAIWSLFIADIAVPQWMTVRNLFHLRTKVLTFVSIILPLGFMGKMLEADGLSISMLYSGTGVFLVLLAIFLLIRFGSPSGDEGMAREGNRVMEPRSQGDRRQESRSRDYRRRDDRRSGNRPTNRTDQDEWLKKQKEELKFQKDSLEKAVDKDISGETGGSNVTVKPGPRRPRGRR